MVLVLLAALCVVAVPLTGGRLTALGDIRLRAGWLILLALGIQIVIVDVVPEGDHALHAALHIGTYAMAGVALWLNRRLPGVRWIALGAALNLAAIVANGGVMPAAPWALRAAGLQLGAGFANSAPVARAHLQALGDVIPVPGPPPLGNVLSAGDLILFAGGLVLLLRTCRPGASPDGTSHRRTARA